MARDDRAGLLRQAEERPAGARKAIEVDPAENVGALAASLAAAIVTGAPYWMVTGSREVCSLPATRSGSSRSGSSAASSSASPSAEGRRSRCSSAGAAGAPERSDDPDPRVSDLGHFRPGSARFEPLASGNFTVVGKLAQGINGDIFRYKWRTDGEGEKDVTVKKLRVSVLEKQLDTERDERSVHMLRGSKAPEAEDALTEIGVLSYLAGQPDLPAYLLRMLGVYSAREHVWLATEFCDGGDLFEVVAAGGVREAQARVYMRQILQAAAYLHKHHIGHRDISLENVLLKGGEVRLMDFGMSVRSHSSSGAPLRFFRAVGKNYYRAPESYVPAVSEVCVTAPAGSAPGDVVTVKAAGGYLCEVRLPPDASPRGPCSAEVWGYAASPADVFASGVCLFILLTGNPPFGRATLADALFSYIHSNGDGGLQKLLASWQKELPSPDAMQLMASMMRPESSRRPTADECLAGPWLAAMADAPAAAGAMET